MKMTEEEARLCCRPNNILRLAKIWIQNRKKTPAEFVLFMRETDRLREEHAQANEQKDAKLVKSTAEAYNALTRKWGII
ncbi:hypothetical protein MNY66_16565 (plasmid) [Moellerella wisconsensis]|nr:hypothetical protein [Moellerella wisconsensis]UNH44360.1 hypothetical protein MNY66_16565 [Moellerella wisconsensis]